MNTPETINIEKYANALNNLIGVDSAYLAGDKDVDAIVELIVAAKKLENRVKELTEENEELKDKVRIQHKIIDERAEAIIRHDNFIRDLHKQLESCKADTVQKMQKKIMTKSEYGTINISPWQLDQIAKEMLEENK
jgi:hypothetical protein